MHWRNVDTGYIPSFEEGTASRSKKMPRYLSLGATGEVRPLLKQWSDLPWPRRLLEVALHLLNRRGHPSSEEGI